MFHFKTTINIILYVIYKFRGFSLQLKEERKEEKAKLQFYHYCYGTVNATSWYNSASFSSNVSGIGETDAARVGKTEKIKYSTRSAFCGRSRHLDSKTEIHTQSLLQINRKNARITKIRHENIELNERKSVGVMCTCSVVGVGPLATPFNRNNE